MAIDWGVVCSFAVASSTLSFVSSILVFLLVAYNRRLNTFWNRLILQMAAENVVAYFIGLPTFSRHIGSADYVVADNFGCELQGFLIQWVFAVAVFIKLALVMSMYAKIVHSIEPAKYERRIVAATWGVPFVLAWAPVILPDVPYGPAGPWCWITADASVARLVVFYVPVWVCFLFILFGMARMARVVSDSLKLTEHVASSASGRSAMIKKRLWRQLSLYLVIFLFMWTPGTVNRTLEAAQSPILADYATLLFAVHMTFVTSGGWANLIIFATTNQKTSAHLWRELVHRCCPWRRRARIPPTSPGLRPMMVPTSTASMEDDVRDLEEPAARDVSEGGTPIRNPAFGGASAGTVGLSARTSSMAGARKSGAGSLQQAPTSGA